MRASVAVCAFLGLLVGGSVWAAPSDLALSGPQATNGQSLTITGADFGTVWGGASISWLGGPGGNIEGGVVGQPFAGPAGWSRVNNILQDPVYDATRARSGSKAILFPFGPKSDTGTNSYPEPIRYDTGGADAIYFTYWHWWDTNCNQHKLWRWTSRTDVQDGANTAMTAQYLGSKYNFIMCADANGSNGDCYPGNPSTNSEIAAASNMDTAHPKGEWYRVETYFKSNSAPGAEDATWKFVLYKSGAPYIATDHTTAEDRADGIAGQKRYLWFQNYFGNACPAAPTGYGHAWSDDHYVQTGTQARVEACSGPTWSTRGVCEIQVPTAWSPTSITFTANQGGFNTDTSGYAYVVNHDGAVNVEGVPFIWSGGGSDMTPPTAYGHSPARGATAVAATTRQISLHVSDASDGVDLASIALTVEGVTHTCANGLTCTGSSPDYTVTYIHGTDWSPAQVVDLGLIAADLLGRSLTESWNFTVAAVPTSSVRSTAEFRGDLR